jgi:YHS domain-containing protein
MVRKLTLFTLGFVAVALVVAGCSRGPHAPPLPAEAKAPEAAPAGEHAHKPGRHGGTIVEIGRDNYHAEVVFEKGGTVRLHLLGKDEARVQLTEVQVLTAYARPEGGSEATPFALRPVPQPGDAEGQTSQFLGVLPKEWAGRKVEVTVPSIRFNGERFRFAFASPAAHEEDVPARPAEEEERRLYLTPGGKYTEADVKANGGVTASEKFTGLTSSHNLKPKAGDRICPVTRTKANPKFSWVVDGKTYEFCCPPCVDEFVKTAKEQPEEIHGPEQYIKK